MGTNKTPALISVKTDVFAVVGGRVIPGKNIITTWGTTYYTELVAGSGFTINFGASPAGLHLGSSAYQRSVGDVDVLAEITLGRKAASSGYPKWNDSHTYNRGGGASVYTWLYEYSAGELVASGIIEAAIVNDLTASTASLCRVLFGARFGVTADEGVKVFLNHTVDYSGAVLNSVSDGDTTAVIDPEGVIITNAYDSAGAVSQQWASRFPPFHRRTIWTDA